MAFRKPLRTGDSNDLRGIASELRNLDVRPSRMRGQNFLSNPDLIAAIAACGAPFAGHHVVEIGAGLGALTKELAHASPLTLIEIEASFVAPLTEQFPAAKIVCADATTVDITALAHSEPSGLPLLLMGNIPYSRTTDIVFHLLKHRGVIARAVLLVQREVAERFASTPGGRVYGVTSVMVQSVARLSLGPIIKGTEFYPPTKVESRVVILDFTAEEQLGSFPYEKLSRTVHAAFCKRRKMIHNSLRASGFYSAQQIDDALASAGIVTERRAETLTVAEYLRLSQLLEKE